MTDITIIGKGRMGKAIASLAERGGYAVQLLGSKDKDVEIAGAMAILAIHHDALETVLNERRASLAGKIVVDISVPVETATFDRLLIAPDTSAAAEIAAALPESKVVKAFSTNNFATIETGKIGGLTTTVFVASDHADATAAVSKLVTDGGLKAIDAGPLRRARELEAIGLLHVSLASRGQIAWSDGFAIVG